WIDDRRRGCALEAGAARRLADQRLLGLERAPRLGGDAAEGDAGGADPAVGDVEPDRGRGQGERERRAVAHLDVARVRGERRRRELDVGDQLALLERVLDL